jgi:hypothetical protein
VNGPGGLDGRDGKGVFLSFEETTMSHGTLRRSGAIIAVAAVLLAAPGWAQGSKPRAVFKETNHDFGKVKQGDVVSCEFVFKNAGGAPLVIERVETTCGCTAALASRRRSPRAGKGRSRRPSIPGATPAGWPATSTWSRTTGRTSGAS